VKLWISLCLGALFGKSLMFRSHEMLDTSSTPRSITQLKTIASCSTKTQYNQVKSQSLLPESSEPKVWSRESNQ